MYCRHQVDELVDGVFEMKGIARSFASLLSNSKFPVEIFALHNEEGSSEEEEAEL
jgi:hypothetical protein